MNLLIKIVENVFINCHVYGNQVFIAECAFQRTNASKSSRGYGEVKRQS